MKQTEMHKKSIDWYYFLKGRHRPAYLKITSITTGEGNGNPLLPGKSHGQRRLVGCSPWGR